MFENRLLLLAIIVVLSLITIQGYLNWQYLQVQEKQLEREINQALEFAGNNDRERRHEIILEWLEKEIRDSTKIRIFSEWSEEDGNWVMVLAYPNSDSRYLSFTEKEYKGKRNEPPTRDQIISFIVDDASKNLREKAVVYYTDDIGEGMIELTSSIAIDTFQIKQDFNSELSKSKIPEHYELYFQADQNFPRSNNDLISQAVDLNIFNDDFYVIAVYTNPLSIVLRRSALIIFSSILIILSSAFIYFFMTRAFRRQKKLQDMKDDFIDQISHELRTPLATLKVAIEALDKPSITPNQNRDYLQICDLQIDRLSSMVDSIVTNTSLTPQALFKDDSFQLNIALMEEIHRQKIRYGDSLNANVPSENLMANGDKQHFQQAIGNLIDNAITHNEASNKKVEVQLTSDSEWIDIQIADNGQGIPDQISKRVFEKYIRASEKVKGLGIGLYYVQNVVTHMHGKVSFVSDSSGTTFTIRLPKL